MRSQHSELVRTGVSPDHALTNGVLNSSKSQLIPYRTGRGNEHTAERTTFSAAMIIDVPTKAVRLWFILPPSHAIDGLMTKSLIAVAIVELSRMVAHDSSR
jgi:hypothetical protein